MDSGADRPDVTKALVHERGHLSVRVVRATCRFGELAQPVSLDLLDVSARLCDVEGKKHLLQHTSLDKSRWISTNSASLSDSQSRRGRSRHLQSS